MLSIPVPDVDRTEHLLLLGANPLVSNGSLLTAPDMRGRLRAIRERGGKVVVVDPRRTRTAEEADEHHFIRPGTDALLLAAMAYTLVEEGLDDARRARRARRRARRAARARARVHARGRGGRVRHRGRRDPPAGARAGGRAERAAVYARIGTCTQEFGTLASWLVDVLNVLTGNLDREGGAMFTRAAAGQTNSSGAGGSGRGVRFGRWPSRVRGLPEAYGELPVAALAEEIDTPGEGQVRALVDGRRQPAACRRPNCGAADAGARGARLHARVDIYVNETTRHADVILPAPSPLEKSHYDLALYQLAVRNVANYSPPVLERDRAARVARRCCGSPASSPARARTPTSRRSTRW